MQGRGDVSAVLALDRGFIPCDLFYPVHAEEPFKDTAEIATEVTEKASCDQANDLVWFEEMERK